MVGDMDLDDDTYVQILRQNIKDCDEMHVRLVEMEKRAGEIEAAHEEARRASRSALAFIRESGAAPPPHGVISECSSDFYLEIKSVGDDDQRILAGVATAPSVDRHGDIVDPLGATYEREIPLLLNHDSTQVVGIARLGKATSGGIPFEASIAKIVAPGTLQDRCNEAWLSVKNKLIRHVSIGFRALDLERLDGGGLRHKAIEILELSLVPVPAQPKAEITAFKSAQTTPPRSEPDADRCEWMSCSRTEAADFLQAELATFFEEMTLAGKDLLNTCIKEEGTAHTVSISQAQYNYLRQLPLITAMFAWNSMQNLVEKVARGIKSEFQAHQAETKVCLDANRRHIGNLERKFKAMRDGRDE